MIKIKKYRNEWKYRLNNRELSLLKSRIENVINLDSHIKNNKYIIHSLYFDDYKDYSLNSTLSRLSNRFKWRIRYYDSDTNYLVLERKEKKEGRCHKKQCRLSNYEFNSIISGNITDILYDTDKQLIKELARDIMLYNFKPKVIVDYERIAYVEEVTNVRITFDMKISASYELDKFLTNDYFKFYIDSSKYNILEVKFDYILPSYIKKIVESYGFIKTSFSKYCCACKLIDSYFR